MLEYAQRKNLTYQFTITPNSILGRETASIIDARIYGNVTRFISHSCNPCLSPFWFIRHSESSREFPQLGFVFNRDVVAGNEVKFLTTIPIECLFVVSIDYGEGYWNEIAVDCCCGSFGCRKPSSKTTYWTKESSDRAKTCENAEEKVNSRIVQEALLCRKRLELVRRGKSVEDAIRLLPTKRRPRKRTNVHPFHPEDRCPSPLTMPMIETLD